MAGPGLQLERTRLAWMRTALSAAAFGGIALKAGLSHHVVADLVAAGCALAAAIGFYLAGHLRRFPPSAPVLAPVGVMMRIAVVACLCAATSTLVAVIVHRG